MKVLYSWLKEYVDIDLQPKELETKLFSVGFEVEGMDYLGENLVLNSNGPRILVSFGIFSVIRIVRPTQLLVQATDYSVPDKECTDATNNDDPCAVFKTIAFPVAQFKASVCQNNAPKPTKPGGCGCGRNG